MKIFLSLLVFLLSIGSVFAENETQKKIDSLYKDYTNNVEKYCKPTDPNLWADWKKNNLIKKEQVNYSSIGKEKEGNSDYKLYLKEINGTPSMIDIVWFGIGPQLLETASYVYKETMNTIYVCAVINTKIRIIDNLLKKIPTTQSNTKKKYEQQLKNLQKNLTNKGCRDIKDTSELSLKKAILDNTTYQYCNYRYYLSYLDQASRESIQSFYSSDGEKKNKPKWLKELTTDSMKKSNLEYMTQEINRTSAKITAEINHTKEIFPQAMVAFSEFDKTYASHILLEFILQDYVDLRVSLKKLLNPIGQVIYKASNAQAPMN